MAKHYSHILDMARKGAEYRYEELKSEIAALVKSFPHLASRTRKQLGRAAGSAIEGRKVAIAAVTGDSAPRKRRKMSAKARAAISAAQKKRWAAQKAADKK